MGVFLCERDGSMVITGKIQWAGFLLREHDLNTPQHAIISAADNPNSHSMGYSL